MHLKALLYFEIGKKLLQRNLAIVGLLKPGPEDQFKIGHNYFINVLLYESWIRNASHLHIEVSEEFEKVDVGYMNKRMYDPYSSVQQKSSIQKRNSSPGHLLKQRTCLKLLFLILFCINTSIQ